MAIPTLNADGNLPEAVHVCGLDEIKARFGSFQDSDRRPQLFATLSELIGELRKSSLLIALVMNGSFVTGKAAPNDVDVLIVLGKGHDWQADLTPGDYALLSHSRLRRRFGFDVLVAEDDSELVLEICALLQPVARIARSHQRHLEDRAMTIEENKLAKTIEQLELMNDALRVLRLEILPKNSRLFAIMADGPLAEIEKLRRQIEEQAQLLAAA